jgi:DNA-binding transcriptional LysR family regulator
MEITFCLFGSPDYLERTGRPRTVAELAGHALLQYSGMNVGDHLLLDGPDGKLKMAVRTVMQSENETVLHMGAVQGMGLVFLPTWMVEADLAAGRLEPVLPDTIRFSNTLHAVYPSRKYLSAKVRTFIDFLASEFPAGMETATLSPASSRSR